MARIINKNYQTAFDKVERVWSDVEELDLRSDHRGPLTVAMTNLMLAQSINQFRIDMNENFTKLAEGIKTTTIMIDRTVKNDGICIPNPNSLVQWP
jgi:hypothetical protein